MIWMPDDGAWLFECEAGAGVAFVTPRGEGECAAIANEGGAIGLDD